MFELVKVEKKEINGEIVETVNGRDLWKALEIKEEFTNWMPRNLQIFSEIEDYQRFEVNVKSGALNRNIVEYALTLDCAKNTALISKTSKGKLVRRYFIEVEKKAKQLYKKNLTTESTTKAKIAIQDCLDVAKMFEVPKHYAQIEAVKQAKQITGIDYSQLLLKAPEQDQIEEKDIYLEPNDFGKIYNISGGKFNKILKGHGLQTKGNDSWLPTKKGNLYSILHSWTKNNKSGYNYKWNVSKIKVIIGE